MAVWRLVFRHSQPSAGRAMLRSCLGENPRSRDSTRMAQLTPAEELGLSGLSLDGRIRQVFYGLDSASVVQLLEQFEAEAFRRGLIYYRDGKPESIRVMLRPIGVMPEQLAYLNFVSISILNALKRLPDLYLEDETVRNAVPLAADEDQWLRENWSANLRENNPVFGRLDAMVDFTSPMWKDSLRFVEPNLCGVGGLHLRSDGRTTAGRPGAAGHSCPRPAIADGSRPGSAGAVDAGSRSTTWNPSAGRAATSVSSSRNLPAKVPTSSRPWPSITTSATACGSCTPTRPSCTSKADEVRYEGHVVDLAYRDYEVHDLLGHGAPRASTSSDPRGCSARTASSRRSAGDFDHKSCWEILTDPQLMARHFQAEERQIFRRHILWTRNCPTAADSPAGRRHGRPGFVRAVGAANCWCSSPTVRTAATAC